MSGRLRKEKPRVYLIKQSQQIMAALAALRLPENPRAALAGVVGMHACDLDRLAAARSG